MNEQESTRVALLDAAEEVFSQQGFSGASVRSITGLARANLGAISYHFGGKQALFDAVILRVQIGLLAALQAAVAEPGSAGERLERIVRAHFGYLADHPRVRRLVLQVLLRCEEAPATVLDYVRRAMALVAGVIAEGQASGEFRAGDPTALALSVVSQPLMLNIMRPMLKRGPGLDLDDPAVRDRMLAHAARFIRAGLRRDTEV